MALNRIAFIACAVTFISVLGCGGFATNSVAGKVTLNGEALSQGTVTLIPESSEFPAPSNPVGAIQEDGSFLISTAKLVGAPPGEYKVVVASTVKVDPNDEYSVTKSVIPKEYCDAATSPLRMVVPSENYDISMVGKSPN